MVMSSVILTIKLTVTPGFLTLAELLITQTIAFVTLVVPSVFLQKRGE